MREDSGPKGVLGGADPADEGAQLAAAEAEAEAEVEKELGEPEDDLGVEIEITPAGKSMKRLTLLSGGEKSMTAIAFLFAVFLAKPCPFYILDEVEAALDDLNIGRFLELLRTYRDRAQFIVVTHQKRTMEAADMLYGVSMGGDGVSKVVSRRLPQEAVAEAVERRGLRRGPVRPRTRSRGCRFPRGAPAYRAAHARAPGLVARPPPAHAGGQVRPAPRGARPVRAPHLRGPRRLGAPRRRAAPRRGARGAAAREAREELGIHAAWTEIATIRARGRPKTTTLTVFVADLPGSGGSRSRCAGVRQPDRMSVDPGEIAEARWATLEHPPRPLSPSAAVILDLGRAAS